MGFSKSYYNMGRTQELRGTEHSLTLEVSVVWWGFLFVFVVVLFV